MERYRRLKKKKLKQVLLFIALLGLVISLWLVTLGEGRQEEADSYKSFWGSSGEYVLVEADLKPQGETVCWYVRARIHDPGKSTRPPRFRFFSPIPTPKYAQICATCVRHKF